jgi:putative transposase
VSIRRACSVLEFDRSTYHYKSRRREQAGVEARIKEICQTRVRYGYRRVHVLLRREGWEINLKRTHRIYNELALQLRNKTPKRRVKAKLRDDRRAASTSNDVWAMDFVHDQLATGQKIRVLTVVDTFSRFSPALDPRLSYRAEDVVATLERACATTGYPTTIRVDQGTEFVSRDLDLWAYAKGVTLDFSRPGKPTDNAFIEAFNGRFRAECLNAHWFLTLADARKKLEDWRKYYNRASEHPSVYAIELNKLCWSWSGPAGRLAFRWARSTIDLAASVMSSARAKIQGPSLNGWRASISPASVASRSVFDAIFRTCAASERLSQGSTPSAAALNTGMRWCDRNDVTRSRLQRLP